MSDYDAIILGAGHNGLILQAYLGKAGLKTLCIERRDTIGGGLSTIDHPPESGYRHNIHSFFHRAITDMPWFQDLELGRHGVEYIEPELNVALILKDHRTLEWWTDFEKTVESFASFSRRDAETLRRWRDEFLPITQKILIPEATSPPLPPDERTAILNRSPEGKRLLEVSALSPLEFVTKEFEHPAIQAGLLLFKGLREVDLRTPGFGHHIASLLASPTKAQLCRGGSAALAEALRRAVEENGGAVRTGVELKCIVVEDGRAIGIETVEGERILASQFVASSLNPQQTFLELLSEEHVPAAWRDKARGFKYNLLAPLFALNVCLDEPPKYIASEKIPHLNSAFMTILGLDHFEQFPEIVEHHKRGTIPPTVMWGACPTLFDSTQAPPGKHTAFMWEKLPYHLNGNPKSWDAEKDRHGDAMLRVWSTYAPNMESAVTDWFTRSALDTERTLPNMREGDLLVGAFTNGQVGYHRPFPGAGHYRSHLPGLYLCGSCCHPGGNITGLPAYNAAQVLIHDLEQRGQSMQ